MSRVIPFLLKHGYALIFGSVLAEQLGAPISSVPVFLGAGALAGARLLAIPQLLVLSVAGCVLADACWYYLGRRRGYSILRILCRISLEPDSCVRRTEERFSRRGGRALLVAKFIPGLGVAGAPLAGLLRMSLPRFLAWDAAGSLLWSGAYIITGYVFSAQLDRLGVYAAGLGAGLVILLAGGLAAYLAWKYWQRRRFLRSLRISRITPLELLKQIQAGEQPFVVDLRGAAQYDADPNLLPGAIHLLPEELDQRHEEIPRDRDVVLYCT
jgi:membrane protein DedA with SNARE-associated domain